MLFPVSLPCGLFFLLLQKVAVLFEKAYIASGLTLFRFLSISFSTLAVPFIQLYYYCLPFWLTLINTSPDFDKNNVSDKQEMVIDPDKISSSEIRAFYVVSSGEQKSIQMILNSGEKILMEDVDPETIEHFSNLKGIPFLKKVD